MGELWEIEIAPNTSLLVILPALENFRGVQLQGNS